MIKTRSIPSFSKRDADRIRLPRTFIVLLQFGPQPARLHSHHRVETGIELRALAEYVRPNHILLELRAISGQRFLHREAQKGGHALRMDEVIAGQEPV